MNKKIISISVVIGVLSLLAVGIYVAYTYVRQTQAQIAQLQNDLKVNKSNLATVNKAFLDFKKTDQVKRNDDLQTENENINKTYTQAVAVYESLIKLREQTNKTAVFDERFSTIVSWLADRNYASAAAQLVVLQKDIKAKQTEIANSYIIPQNIATNNSPPSSGYQRQVVETDKGSFMIDIISANLNSTKVIVDTGADSTCGNDCPVMALGDYAARSGAFAAINGQYFCPADYPSCSSKKNSFDTLLMNKNKTYFNSENNVYSSNPAAVFGQGYARFMGQAKEWGRDTGVDGVISNYPLLISNGEVLAGGGGAKGSRSFIGSSGEMVYIGVVHNATIEEVAHVMKKLGIQNALNLDSGGSTALWQNGRYIVGPGRSLPFGILFVRR